MLFIRHFYIILKYSILTIVGLMLGLEKLDPAPRWWADSGFWLPSHDIAAVSHFTDL